MADEKKYVLDGAIVRCSNGASIAKIKVTTNQLVYADNKKVATEMDIVFLPQTFGVCTPFAGTPGSPCVCTPVPPWSKPHSKQKYIGFKPLLGKSTLKCARPTPKGFGKITIEHNMQFLAKEYSIKPEKLRCPKPKCRKFLSDKDHKCNDIPPGDYEGDGGKLGNEIIKKHYSQEFKKHPFYVPPSEARTGENDRNGIEAHHLLSSSAVRTVEKNAALIRMLGYSTNHRKNGVLLPTFMQVACAYGVPLHNGGHAATFVQNKDIVEDLKTISKWEFKIPESKEKITAIFPGFDPLNEIAVLNYEDHIIDIVTNTCENFILEDICNVEKRLEIAKKFITRMDKQSQVVFKKLSTFQWTLVSDGLDYAPGGIGCCKCIKLEDKRDRIRDSLTDVKLPKKGVKNFWTKVLSSPEICEEISKQSFICTAGANIEPHPLIKGINYYQERKGLKDFEKFKNKS